MKQTTYIDLLRHGETEGSARFHGSINDRLSELGWTQMWTAVESELGWDHIISSPLARCADFGHALAEQYSISIDLDERIKEMHFGTWEGCTATQLMATDPNALSRFWKDPLRHTPPQAEALIAFEERVLSAWHDIVANHNREKILLISHGGVMRVILCHVLQHPIPRLLEIEIGHATLRRIGIDNPGGCSHVVVDGRKR